MEPIVKPRQKLPPTKAQKEADRLARSLLTTAEQKNSYYAQQENERIERERQMQAFFENQRLIAVAEMREAQRVNQAYLHELEERERLNALRIQKEMRLEEEKKKTEEAIKEAKRLRHAQEKQEREEAKKEKMEKDAQEKKKRTEPLVDNVFKYHVAKLNAVIKAEQAKVDIIAHLMHMARKKNMDFGEIQAEYNQMILRLEQSGMKMPDNVHIRTGYQFDSEPIKKKEWVETMAHLNQFLIKRAMHKRERLESQLRQEKSDQLTKMESKLYHTKRYNEIRANDFKIKRRELKEYLEYQGFYESLRRLDELKSKPSLTLSENLELQIAINQEVLEELEEKESIESKHALIEQFTAEIKAYQKNIVDLKKLYELVIKEKE